MTFLCMYVTNSLGNTGYDQQLLKLYNLLGIYYNVYWTLITIMSLNNHHFLSIRNNDNYCYNYKPLGFTHG